MTPTELLTAITETSDLDDLDDLARLIDLTAETEAVRDALRAVVRSHRRKLPNLGN